MLAADFFVSIVTLCTVRLLMILVFDAYKSKVRDVQKRIRVLIFGVGDKSVSIVTRLRGSKHYEVRGLLSKDKDLKNSRFMDMPVFVANSAEELKAIADSNLIGGIIFATKENLFPSGTRWLAMLPQMVLKCWLCR